MGLLFHSGCSEKTDVIDLTFVITPLSIAPSVQNGYGSGMNQLAQPDDVELLSDGSMIVTDVNNNRIQHFSSEGLLLNSLSSQDLGLENSEILPTGISKDGGGFIYITLEGAGIVARLNPDLEFDQFIGKKCDIAADSYYKPENDSCLIFPQGVVVAENGDIYVIDMAKKVFENNKVRNFGFRKFKQVKNNGDISYIYDREFADTQEITKVMRKSEGMAISSDQNTLFIAEEKPQKTQFGNISKKRYIAAFDLKNGRFLDRLIGVNIKNDSIIDGYFNDSVEGVCVSGKNLFAVDEKAGKIFIFDVNSGQCKAFIGKKAIFYCDDNSNCVIDGINYNEQTIMAGIAKPHLKNDWRRNELASPDGISAIILADGSRRIAVVDQWNSRVLVYDFDKILHEINL
tara:strand:- start:520 stop:1722 length:1203 start_codon:yes stop_codon:yes gene_type:complete